MRWRTILQCLLVASVAAATCGVLGSHNQRTPSRSTRMEQYLPWNESPGEGATGNLIFQSLASLMQMAPNSKYPVGHSIVRSTVPPGTLLYHGRGNSDYPTMDWLAFDPEHSQTFLRTQNGTLFTFMTARELKLVYFDGCSANKRGGVTDTQDILIWGEIGHGREPWHSDPELDRIADACAWARKHRIDGFIRMEYDYEIMYCDFSQGLALVSSLDTPSDAHLVPPLMEVRHAGSRHNAFPGESRVQVDPTTLISFFDPALASLTASRQGLSRMQYRVTHISKEDMARVRADITEVMSRDSREKSGVDWLTLARVIQERFGDRLLYIQHLLHRARVVADVSPRGQVHAQLQSITATVQKQIIISLSPYMPREGTGEPAWFAAIAYGCATSFTGRLPDTRFTKQERLLLYAVDEVLHEICRIYTEAWRDAFGLEVATTESNLHENITSPLLDKWRVQFDALIEWLDWPSWLKCDPACNVDVGIL
ncbi:hypothetical protein DAEQUDRAFT_268672 [Daedalea quercina L-15889]|uniref:Uncharacterized protein n=1 Tax=Daedalea quercina L-15889 TaxID=1314783 RepID=A0A165QAQ3_9APHY|nr:hypothetical protein DAEQUDRAFT_268672 [Daedalea quercina L-15889]